MLKCLNKQVGLIMTLIVDSKVLSPMTLFQEMSRPNTCFSWGFNKHITVDAPPLSASVSSYTIRIRDKFSGFYPLRFFLRPELPDRKIVNFKNLRDLTKLYAKQIIQDPSCDVCRITAVIERLAGNLARHTSHAEANTFRDIAGDAIYHLETACLNDTLDYYRKGQPGRFHERDALPHAQFYRRLASSWWPLGFNEKIYVGRRNQKSFVWLAKKSWSFQKWMTRPEDIFSLKDYIPLPEPGPSLVATAENLQVMITEDRELLRYLGADIDNMVDNLFKLKQEITRHTNQTETYRIHKALCFAIKELSDIKKLADQDFQKTWKGFIARWTINWII